VEASRTEARRCRRHGNRPAGSGSRGSADSGRSIPAARRCNDGKAPEMDFRWGRSGSGA